MGGGGRPHAVLEALRQDYPLSFHGVGLSLVSYERLDGAHLAKLKNLIRRYEPGLVSEHLAWSAWGGRFFNDLFPLPLTEETLRHAIRNVEEAQERLGRRMLIENPSLYGLPSDSDISEEAFLSELAERTGCGLLLDINNVYVSASNLGFVAEDYIDAFPMRHVGEVHLAGHSLVEGARIDDHASPVCDEVWALLKRFLQRKGKVPILIEWDKNIPDLGDLLAQSQKAQTCLDGIKP